MSEPTVIYYRWAYSPSTGDVSLAHNHEGHPTDVRFHTDMATERPEADLTFGFAHKSADNWKVTDDDSRPVDDPNVIHNVVHAVTKHEDRQKLAAKLSYESGTTKWAWVEGQPPEWWEDNEIGGGWNDAEVSTWSETQQQHVPKPGFDEDGIRAHFEVLVELGMKDPVVAEHVANWEGHSYTGMNYSTVARALNESGKKWAIGVYDDDILAPDDTYKAGLEIGAHGPTTSKEDVEKALGKPVVSADKNSYGLGQYNKWDDEDLWDDEEPVHPDLSTLPIQQPGTFT